MKRVEIRVRDEAEELISEQSLALDIAGRFDQIEQAVEALRQQALKTLEGDLLEAAPARRASGCI